MTRQKRYVTYAQMIEVMMTINHAQPIGIVTTTVPKMRKTSNPFFGRIMKLTDSHVFTNCNYQAMVNRRREKAGIEPGFTAGQRIIDYVRRTVNGKNTPVLDYTNKAGSPGAYLEVNFMPNLKTTSRFVLDGVTDIQKSEFQEFLQDRSGSASHQGLSPADEVIIRTYNIRNIVELRYAGTDYVMI